MQPTISSMIGYEIRATDGDLGKVDQFYITRTVKGVKSVKNDLIVK